MRVILFAVCMLLHAMTLAADKPNIVFILADDLGYGDLSSYGATLVETPNIDRLADAGMRFTDAHSPHSVCTPTRYSLLTGRYAWRNWAGSRCVWSNDPLLISTDRLTLPKLLQNAGYRTALIGKWHLGFGAPDSPGWSDRLGPDYNMPLKPGPLEVGFDYFFGIPHVGQFPHILIENHNIVGKPVDENITFIVDPRQADRRSYLDRENIVPRHTFAGMDGFTYEHEELAIQLTDKAVDWLKAAPPEPFFLAFMHRNVHSPIKPNARFKNTSAIGSYGDFINELDWSVGRILDTLDELGLNDNTLVIFSSDNGAVQKGHQATDIVDHNGHKSNGPLRGQKTEAYEGGHRVPLLARWPGHIAPATESQRLVALTDVFATVAEMLDVDIPRNAGEDSFSFWTEMVGGTSSQPVRRAIVDDSNMGIFAIREGDWKLILGQGGGGIGWTGDDINASEPAGQLYHLGQDLDERKNLYNQHPDIVTHLTNLLGKYKANERSAPRDRH
jgi:arylsulfatase A